MQQLPSASDSSFSPKPALHLHQVWKDQQARKIALRCSPTFSSPSPSPWVSPTNLRLGLDPQRGNCALQRHIPPTFPPWCWDTWAFPQEWTFIASAPLTWCINYDHVQRIVLERGSVLVQKPCPADLQIRNAHELFEEREVSLFLRSSCGREIIYI